MLNSLKISILFTSIFTMSCMHDVPIVVDESTICSTDTVYFVQSVLPLLNTSCGFSGCHDNASHQEGVRMDTYSNILKTVRPGKPTSSELYKVLIDSGDDAMPPYPYDKFSQSQVDVIYKWIAQGAKNNSCNEDEVNCNILNVSYVNDIKPIMATYCNACHGGSANQGNITGVDSYIGLKTLANNGSLEASVNGSVGFVRMPYGSASLSDCKISKIAAWVADGAPNN